MQLSDEQVRAIDLFLANPTYGCFDPPGAGKTAVAINAAIEQDKWPILITMPAHLVPQWKLQFELWGMPENMISAAPRGCGAANRHEALNTNTAVTLVSYNTWSSKAYTKELLNPKWQAFVFDESHRLRRAKNATAVKQTVWSNVRLLRTKTRSKHVNTPIWFLSGTPLVKNGVDIWPFLFLCNKYKYGNKDKFAQNICYTFRGTYGLEIGAVRDPEAFQSLLGRYSIRRSWRQLPGLKDLTVRHVDMPIELSKTELNRHRAIKRDYVDPLTGERLESTSAMLHALRRLSVSAKADALTEWLEDHSGPGMGSSLVLCWYRDTCRAMVNAVGNTGRPVVRIDGSTSERDRQVALSLYQRGNVVLVGTIAAMKEGWDSLQSGHNVVFVEQHYLATDNEQAYKRVARRGQNKPVIVTWMYAPKTIDVRVRRAAKNRGTDIATSLGEFMTGEEWR